MGETDAADDTKVWLAERSYGVDEDLVTLVYATTDGEQCLRKQLAPNLVQKQSITAARTVPSESLEAVNDADRQDRYATEATRMKTSHDPDEAV